VIRVLVAQPVSMVPIIPKLIIVFTGNENIYLLRIIWNLCKLNF